MEIMKTHSIDYNYYYHYSFYYSPPLSRLLLLLLALLLLLLLLVLALVLLLVLVRNHFGSSVDFGLNHLGFNQWGDCPRSALRLRFCSALFLLSRHSSLMGLSGAKRNGEPNCFAQAEVTRSELQL